MRENGKDIDERLIPYIEGVLDEREQAEFQTELEKSPELSQEVAELTDFIKDLQHSFASGARPPQESLSPEDIVRLASHEGGIEKIPGTPEEKARLFLSDQNLSEYELLRSLSKDMRVLTMEVGHIPPMPAEIQAEFLKLSQPESKISTGGKAKVVPIPLWRRLGGQLEKINPKPFMAAAAALAMVSIGAHFYQGTGVQSSNSGPVAVAPAEDTEENSGAKSEVTDAVDSANGNTAEEPPLPEGITVFTSSDKDLLNKQAEKLLASKVRYTMTGDRLLVSGKDLKEAREVLWGAPNQAVAVSDGTDSDSVLSSDEARPVQRLEQEAPSIRDKASAGLPRMKRSSGRRAKMARPVVESQATMDYSPTAPAVAKYDFRQKGESQKRLGRSSSASGYSNRSAPPPTRVSPPAAPSKPERPKVRAKSRVTAEAAARPTSEFVRADGSKPSPPKKSTRPVESAEERKQRLRDLALGATEKEKDKEQNAPPPAKGTSVPKPELVQLERSAPKPVEPKVQPAVANAVTRDASNEDDLSEQDIAMAPENEEVPRPASLAKKSKSARPGHIAGRSQGSSKATTRRNSSRPTAPVAQQEVNSPSVREMPDAAVRRVPQAPSPVLATAPAPAPPPAPAAVQSQDFSAEDEGDNRLASIRSLQARVASRHQVVLSVESRGSTIKVYVRPKRNLTNDEINELRGIIRKELGLQPQDSLIFR